MKNTRVAINGFGRIGRMVARIIAENQQLDLVAINDLHDSGVLTHLLRYDSVHGRLAGEVFTSENTLHLGRHRAEWLMERDPSKLPWDQLEVDIVLDCTGINRSLEKAGQHLHAGAKRVIISAPPEGDGVKTVVMGINDHILQSQDLVVSNASCTTNCAAPMIKVIDDLCGMESCYITTIHSYTGDQRLHDAPHKDWRRARAAAESIVPTSTGAAKAISKIFPHLKGEMGGCGMRVPVPNGSLTDITCIVSHPKSVSDINRAFQIAATEDLNGILEYTEDPIVSRDIIGSSASCVYDALLTSVVGGMVKLIGWYDNEAGYSHRLIDLAIKMGKMS
jgi:glyceraldehyde 3-phosphate dehydrogenase